MINSLLITNLHGNVVFSKYFSIANEEKQLEFEKLIYQFTKEEWMFAKNEKHLIAEINGIKIVYTNIGDLMLFLCGSDEYDELALSEIIFPLLDTIKEVCKKKGVTEAHFIEQIPKFVLYLDEIIQKGQIDQTQIESIINYSALKHDQPIKKETV